MRNGRTCDDQVVSCVTTPPRAAEHAKAIRTHAGGKLRALRAASLRSGPLACLRRRGGHSLTRERASCSNRAPINPQKRLRSLALAAARSRRGANDRGRGWVTAAASRVTRRPTWRAGAVCRSCRVAAACVPCRLPTWRAGCCSSTCWWGTRADHFGAGGLPVALWARQGRVRSDGGRPAAARRPPDPFGHLPCPRVASIRRGCGSASPGECLLARQPAAPPY